MNLNAWDTIPPKEKRVAQPGPEGLALTAAAQAHISSVPYRATLRFVFYRLWDAGQIPLCAHEGNQDGTSMSVYTIIRTDFDKWIGS